MLFKDKLDFIAKDLTIEFQKLFESLIQEQTHYGDLLLILENGFYNPDAQRWNTKKKKYSPYVIGLGDEGHSANLHYEFIHQYRTNAIVPFSYAQYLSKLETKDDAQVATEQFQKHESFTIQLEMLIYLKIWESDTFIKKFYEIVRLIHNEPYDWHFKIQRLPNQPNTTGRINVLITDKIKNRFKNKFPVIYKAFDLSYLYQLRNSIAHSNYSFLGRNILLNNKRKVTDIHSLTFDEWTDIFHTTMILYNEYIGLFENVTQHYVNMAKVKGNKIQVRINRKNPTECIELCDVVLSEHSSDTPYYHWSWFNKDSNS